MLINKQLTLIFYEIIKLFYIETNSLDVHINYLRKHYYFLIKS